MVVLVYKQSASFDSRRNSSATIDGESSGVAATPVHEQDESVLVPVGSLSKRSGSAGGGLVSAGAAHSSASASSTVSAAPVAVAACTASAAAASAVGPVSGPVANDMEEFTPAELDLLADAEVRVEQQAACRDTMLSLKEAFEGALSMQARTEAMRKADRERLAALQAQHAADQQRLAELLAQLDEDDRGKLNAAKRRIAELLAEVERLRQAEEDAQVEEWKRRLKENKGQFSFVMMLAQNAHPLGALGASEDDDADDSNDDDDEDDDVDDADGPEKIEDSSSASPDMHGAQPQRSYASGASAHGGGGGSCGITGQRADVSPSQGDSAHGSLPQRSYAPGSSANGGGGGSGESAGQRPDGLPPQDGSVFVGSRQSALAHSYDPTSCGYTPAHGSQSASGSTGALPVRSSPGGCETGRPPDLPSKKPGKSVSGQGQRHSSNDQQHASASTPGLEHRDEGQHQASGSDLFGLTSTGQRGLDGEQHQVSVGEAGSRFDGEQNQVSAGESGGRQMVPRNDVVPTVKGKGKKKSKKGKKEVGGWSLLAPTILPTGCGPRTTTGDNLTLKWVMQLWAHRIKSKDHKRTCDRGIQTTLGVEHQTQTDLTGAMLEDALNNAQSLQDQLYDLRYDLKQSEQLRLQAENDRDALSERLADATRNHSAEKERLLEEIVRTKKEAQSQLSQKDLELQKMQKQLNAQQDTFQRAQAAWETEKRSLKAQMREMSSDLQQALTNARRMQLLVDKMKKEGGAALRDRLAQLVADLEAARSKLASAVKDRDEAVGKNDSLNRNLAEAKRKMELERQFLPLIHLAKGPVGQPLTKNSTSKSEPKLPSIGQAGQSEMLQ